MGWGVTLALRRRLQRGVTIQSAPMNEYRHVSHSDSDIHTHLIWVTKYLKPVLVGRRRGQACPRGDPEDLRGPRRPHPPGTHQQGSRASAFVDPSEGDDQPPGAEAEGEGGVQDVASVRGAAAGVLGLASVGAGVLLLQHGERDGRGDNGVDRESGGVGAGGSPRGAWRLLSRLWRVCLWSSFARDRT